MSEEYLAEQRQNPTPRHLFVPGRSGPRVLGVLCVLGVPGVDIGC